MNNEPLTEQDVFKAADDIFQQTGKAPTGRELLSRLKRGSMSTISRHLQSWSGINLPYVQLAKQSSDLAKLTHSIFSNLSVNAQTSAQLKIDAIQKKLDTSLYDLRTQESEAKTAKDKCIDLEDRVAKLTESLSSAAEVISDLKSEVAKEKSNTETARAIANERHVTNTELKREIKFLNEIKLQSDSRHESDLQTLKTEHTNHVNKLELSERQLKDKLSKLQTENQQLNLSLSESRDSTQRLKEMLERSHQELSDSKKLCTTLNRDLNSSESLQAQIEQDALVKITQKDTEIALLNNTLKSTNRRVVELQKDKSTLTKLLNKQTAHKPLKLDK